MNYNKIINQRASKKVVSYQSDNPFSNVVWKMSNNVLYFTDESGDQVDFYKIKNSDDARDIIEDVRGIYDNLPTGREYIDEVTADDVAGGEKPWSVAEWMSSDRDWIINDDDELVINDNPLHLSFKERAEKLISDIEMVMGNLPSREDIEGKKYLEEAPDVTEEDLDMQMEEEYPDLDLPRF